MTKTNKLIIKEKFVYEVPIVGDFSIIEPGGTFDDLDDPRAQLNINFKDGLVIFSIENICHPRGKITRKKGAVSLWETWLKQWQQALVMILHLLMMKGLMGIMYGGGVQSNPMNG